MGWQSEEFGAFHDGRAAAVLRDGSEPKPMCFDMGSGSDFHETDEWWVYDGTLGAPRAAALRGACSCGWRGTPTHPLDWSRIDRRRAYDHDTSGPERDWEGHIEEVEAQTVPLPSPLQELLDQLEQQLGTLAGQAPLAALKAVAALERTTGHIAREAAHDAQADQPSWEAVGRALGLPAEDARARLAHYIRRG
ncbi:hypothetical protein [Streptomyces sp. ODS28]|uniref:hypothetical protein n=1 Tax=Streptomyces sp. ODS28 TaxID=3136688 RepID=UPI0031E708DB